MADQPTCTPEDLWSPSATWEAAFHLPVGIASALAVDDSERVPSSTVGAAWTPPSYIARALLEAADGVRTGPMPVFVFLLTHCNVGAIDLCSPGSTEPIALVLTPQGAGHQMSFHTAVPTSRTIPVLSSSPSTAVPDLSEALIDVIDVLRLTLRRAGVLRALAVYHPRHGTPECVRSFDVSTCARASCFARLAQSSTRDGVRRSHRPPMQAGGLLTVLQRLGDATLAVAPTLSRPLCGGVDLTQTLRLLRRVVAPASHLGLLRVVRFDAAQQRMLLLPAGLGPCSSALPLTLDPSIFAAALRLVYIDRADPVFSLDPWDPAIPDGPHHRKSFFPGWLGGTAWGEVMFAADYWLKRYALGLARPAATAWAGPAPWMSVLDIGAAQYLNDLEAARATDADVGGTASQRDGGGHIWARVWFSLTHLRACRAGTDLAVRPGDIGFRVEARAVARDPTSRTGLVDLDIDAQGHRVPARVWASAVNSDISGFMALEPAFRRLDELAAALTLAKALHALAVPISHDWVELFSAPVAMSLPRVPTAKNSKTWNETRVEAAGQSGTRTTTLSYSYAVAGGVSLAAPLSWSVFSEHLIASAEATTPPLPLVLVPLATRAEARDDDVKVAGEPSIIEGDRSPAAVKRLGVASKAARVLGTGVTGSSDSVHVLRASNDAGARNGSAAARRLGLSEKAARWLGVATSPPSSGSRVRSCASTSGNASMTGSRPYSCDSASRSDLVPVSTAIQDATTRSMTSVSVSEPEKKSWALLQYDYALESRVASSILEVAPAIEHAPALELAGVLATRTGCAACGQPLYWNVALVERCGLAYCTRAACCAEHWRLEEVGSPDSAAVAEDPLGLAWDADTIDDGLRDRTDGESVESMMSGMSPSERRGVPASIASVLACHGCGEPMLAGQQYLVLNLAARGRVAFHATLPARESQSAESVPTGATTAACMRCEAPGCNKALIQVDPRRGAGTGSDHTKVLGRVVGSALLCGMHAGIADGYGADCAGCGLPLWHVPGAAASARSGKKLEALDADDNGASASISTTTLESGERFHVGCFRCSSCGDTIAGQFHRLDRQPPPGPDSPLRFVCVACYKL